MKFDKVLVVPLGHKVLNLFCPLNHMDKQQKSAYSFCQFSTSPGEDLQETMDFVVPQAVEVAVGQKLSNRYVLRSELGEGGMGKVFLAYDIVLQRNVALKVTLDARSSVSLGSANAFAEGQKAALVNHPMIASVYDTGVHEGRPFTIFEFVDGIDLRKAMGDRPNGWPVEDVAPLLWSLAEALDFAHSRCTEDPGFRSRDSTECSRGSRLFRWHGCLCSSGTSTMSIGGWQKRSVRPRAGRL
jgi:hypothetical protein